MALGLSSHRKSVMASGPQDCDPKALADLLKLVAQEQPSASKTKSPSRTSQEESLARQSDERKPVIPGYELLERLGEEGMGLVYKAEQRVPANRIVALKVIKLGLDTADVIARFASERQA